MKRIDTKNKDWIRLEEKLRKRTHRMVDQVFKLTPWLMKHTKYFCPVIGCDPVFFKWHITKQFRDGMEWSNYPKVWELDHIQPVNEVNLLVRRDFLACANWKNIRPLLVKEHRLRHSLEKFGQPFTPGDNTAVANLSGAAPWPVIWERMRNPKQVMKNGRNQWMIDLRAFRRGRIFGATREDVIENLRIRCRSESLETPFIREFGTILVPSSAVQEIQ